MPTPLNIEGSDIPDPLWRLMDVAEAASGALYIYRNDIIVSSNELGISLYSIDWSSPVTFDDCYWNGIHNKKTIDPSVLRDPSGFLQFAKEHRARTSSYRFCRRYGDDGPLYDRHHIGIDRQWNAQIWIPMATGGAVDFIITPDTRPRDVRQYIARERAISRLTAFLDGSGIAIAVVDETGLLLDSSLSMMRLLCRGQALRLGDDDRIEAMEGSTTLKLRSLAADISQGRRSAALVPLPLSNGNHTLAGLLRAGPLDPAVILTLAQQEKAEELEALLCDAFRLSPSEASVAIHVAEGRTPDAIAALTGRSVHTVRGHLTAAKREMGITRQHDLAAFVTRAASLVGGSTPTKLKGE